MTVGPVDLPRVRRALSNLDKIAAEHPELCRGGGKWTEQEVAKIMGTPANERVKAYRARLREQGNTNISVFLTPDARTALSTLRAMHPGKSINDIVSDVLTGTISIPNPTTEQDRQP